MATKSTMLIPLSKEAKDFIKSEALVETNQYPSIVKGYFDERVVLKSFIKEGFVYLERPQLELVDMFGMTIWTMLSEYRLEKDGRLCFIQDLFRRNLKKVA